MICNIELKEKPIYWQIIGVVWAILKPSAGHIWPTGRMLCMPVI